MTRTNAWTPSSVARFWNYYATHPGAIEDTYFSRTVGGGVADFLMRNELVDSTTSALDYGCGPGFLAEHLIARGATVNGVDSSASSVELANRRLGRQSQWKGAMVSSAPPAPFPDHSFDVVTCLETLEHLDDSALDHILGDIRRLLRVGGTALFTTPNDERLAEAFVYCPFCDTEYHRMQHVRAFTATSLRQRLEAADLRVRFCEPIDLPSLVPGFARAPATALGRTAYVATLARTGIRVARRGKARLTALLSQDPLTPFVRPGQNLVALASPAG